VNEQELCEAFIDGVSIPGVEFAHNEPVLIVRGPHAGGSGSLVALVALHPEPSFVLELSSGPDAQVLQSQIQHVGV
jgi:hypothetical protein